MKKSVTKGFITAAVLAMAIIAAGASAQAQSLHYKLTANIPFDFSVSNQKLPAGKYVIGRTQEVNGDAIVQIKSIDGKSVANRFSIPIVTFKTKKQSELIFHRYGDQYFLSEIWPSGAGTGRAFLKTHAERELARSARDNRLAEMKAPKAEVVTVVATQQ